LRIELLRHSLPIDSVDPLGDLLHDYKSSSGPYA